MRRSEIEMLDSIEKLEQNLYNCYPIDCFGGDNRLKIIIMIEVIKDNRSKAWINSKYLTPDDLLKYNPDDNLWRAAMDARDWMDGKITIEDLIFAERRVYEGNQLYYLN
ncbi:hypothetical protein FFF34_007790 [Inquilinus sp. KBS0705]|nr:hypothetical protein FFF34_007790 [Inquilinus sp. KBS0705]